jgi:plasmid stability protein
VKIISAQVSRYCMYYACMVALQIRGVPQEVRDALAQRAASRGQSLQAYLWDLVAAEARRGRNADVLNRFAGRSDGSVGAAGETAAEVARARRQRERSRR